MSPSSSSAPRPGFASMLVVPEAWRRALLVWVVAACMVVWLLRPTFITMAALWDSSQTYSHGWLVLPMAIWLAWREWHRVAGLPLKTGGWALPLVALLGGAWLMGELVSVNPVTQFAAVLMLALTVPVVFGFAVARAWWFPMAFLLFAVPVGDSLVPLFMNWTADFTVAGLRLSGIPVHREGLDFVIPSGRWSVVEACSGVRYLIASVMVGALFAYLSYQSMTKRLVFIAVSVVVPVVANWLRAYLIVMIGHLSSNKLATGVDHIIYGWVMFGVVMVLLYMIGARWADPPPPKVEATVQASTVPWAHYLGLLVALGLAAAWAPWWAEHRLAAPAASTLVAPPIGGLLPEDIGAWKKSAPAAPDWHSSFTQESLRWRGSYQTPGMQPVDALVVYYRGLGPQRKLVTAAHQVARRDDPIWQIMAQTTRDAPAGSRIGRARETQLQTGLHSVRRSSDRLRVWQWYWVDGQLTASDIVAKWHGAVGKLLGRPDDAAVIFLVTDDARPAAAEAALAAFATQALPALRPQLDALREGGRALARSTTP